MIHYTTEAVNKLQNLFGSHKVITMRDIDWCKLARGWMKTVIDHGLAGAGVMRDSDGSWLVGFCRNIRIALLFRLSFRRSWMALN